MKKQNGLTMIEVLVVTVILSFLGVGILSLQTLIGSSQSDALRNYINTDEADRNVTSFIKEMRNANHGENGAYLLTLTNDQEIIFYSDYDHDAETERIRYFLVGNILSKGIIEPTGTPTEYLEENETVKILSENVQNGANPVFYYYNEDWPQDIINNPLTAGSRISDTTTIKMVVSINENPNVSPINYTAESIAQIRMLKENL